MSPRYEAGNLPEGNWDEYRKTSISKAIEMDHDFEVQTIDGNIALGRAGDYLIVDSEGHPYPCDRFVFAASYVRAQEQPVA